MKSFKGYLKEEGEKQPSTQPVQPVQQPSGGDNSSPVEWDEDGGAKWQDNGTWYYFDGSELYMWNGTEWECVGCDDDGEGEGEDEGEGEGEGGGLSDKYLPSGIPPALLPFFITPNNVNPNDYVPDFTDPKNPPYVLPYNPYNSPEKEKFPIQPIYLDPPPPNGQGPGWYWQDDDGYMWPLKKWDYDYAEPSII